MNEKEAKQLLILEMKKAIALLEFPLELPEAESTGVLPDRLYYENRPNLFNTLKAVRKDSIMLERLSKGGKFYG